MAFKVFLGTSTGTSVEAQVVVNISREVVVNKTQHRRRGCPTMESKCCACTRVLCAPAGVQQQAVPKGLSRKNDLVVWLRLKPLQRAVYQAFLHSEAVRLVWRRLTALKREPHSKQLVILDKLWGTLKRCHMVVGMCIGLACCWCLAKLVRLLCVFASDGCAMQSMALPCKSHCHRVLPGLSNQRAPDLMFGAEPLGPIPSGILSPPVACYSLCRPIQRQ